MAGPIGCSFSPREVYIAIIAALRHVRNCGVKARSQPAMMGETWASQEDARPLVTQTLIAKRKKNQNIENPFVSNLHNLK